MRSTWRTALLCLLLLLGLPGWHIFCKESASSDEAAPVIDDETIKKKDEVEEPRPPEPTEDVDLKPPSQKAEVHILEDCAKDDQSENTEHISPPVAEADSSAGLEDDAPSSAESIERNISSSSTSDTPPAAPSDAIENSSADHPALSSNEAEQSEPDCDSGGALEADPQSEPSSFVSPTESLDQPLENISSRGKVKITKSDLEANIPVAANGSTKQKLSLNASEGVKEKSDSKKTGDLDPTATGGPKDPGDIPTFDEWKKQVLEVEKEKSQSMHPSPNGVPHAAKKVQKNRNNYASVECGAKMLAANPEAKSTSAILIENMDLYMLNPCSTKIWFVIELCEPIQVKQLDIANYELFSSTPKDFLVSISDRYPTNKWVKLGTFHARDERTVQSFPLDEQMYAKYVKMFIKYLKVELVSHFGSEHFCPLSLIRVFGTSMVEEYEESVDSHYQLERQDPYDEDYDYPLDYNTREDKSSKNLLGSATNAILNMVNNLAANMLGANTDEQAAGQGENVSMPDNATEAAITETVQTQTPILLEPTSVPTPGLQTPEVPLPIEEPSEPDVAKEDPIVQLVQEDDEEPRQSTVTLLGNDDQVEDKLAWFESETQVYCSELMTICCVSSFSEFIYKWCSAIVTLHRQRSKTIEVNRENDHDLATLQPLAVPTEDISADVAEQPPLEEFISNNTEETPDVIESLPESLHHESSITKPVEAIELEPSYPQMVSQSDFLDLTSEEKTTSTAISADDTKHKAEQTLQAQTPESTLEIPTEKEKTEPPAPVEMTTMSSETLTVSELEDTNTKEHTEVAPVIKSTQTAPPPETTPTVVDKEEEETKGSASEILKPAVVEELESTPIPEIKEEEQPTDEALLGAHALGGLQRSATDFYAELQNSTELGYANGNLVHGSNQKESVFMRLNNRIKALEVNMSLSSRYLEELSQRYRKQMDEMQKAFNKTIIKLQNTARIAEEQDQRQTESIQLLQSQLTNMTHLVSNLSSTVSELKREVSDRQIILVVALVLALILVLMVCVQCCRNKSPLNEDCISKIPKSNNYPSPKRCFSSYDDMNLKRRTSCPLVRSQSFQLSSKEVDPNDFYIVEPLKFSPEKKKKRCKYKGENIETIKPTDAPRPIANGDLKSKKPFTNQRDFSNMGEVFHSSHKGPPSEGSSETSSQSDESLFCGITTCTNLCNGQPQKTKTEKRAIKRRRSKLQDQGKFIKSLIQTKSGSMPSLHDIIKSNKDITVGTFGVATVSGHI